MRTRQKILYSWLVLVTLVAFLNMKASAGLVNNLFTIIATVVPWYLILRLIFFVYDKLRIKFVTTDTHDRIIPKQPSAAAGLEGTKIAQIRGLLKRIPWTPLLLGSIIVLLILNLSTPESGRRKNQTKLNRYISNLRFFIPSLEDRLVIGSYECEKETPNEEYSRMLWQSDLNFMISLLPGYSSSDAQRKFLTFLSNRFEGYRACLEKVGSWDGAYYCAIEVRKKELDKEGITKTIKTKSICSRVIGTNRVIRIFGKDLSAGGLTRWLTE